MSPVFLGHFCHSNVSLYYKTLSPQLKNVLFKRQITIRFHSNIHVTKRTEDLSQTASAFTKWSHSGRNMNVLSLKKNRGSLRAI